MPRERSFWRNVAIIGTVHLLVLSGLLRWSASAKKPLPRDVVWMEGGALELTPTATTIALPAPSPAEPSEPVPVSTPEQPAEEVAEEAPAASEIPLTSPTPTATPKPTPSPKRNTQSKPQPTPRATPKKIPIAKTSPTPRATPAGKSTSSKRQTPGIKPAIATANGSGGSGSGGNGASNASKFNWYGKMLHDRFFGEWAQPKSIAMSGARMAALVRARIEKDGRISNFAIVRSSGNVIVDESVAAIAKRITQVDPPPAELISGGHYDVQINFELNPE